ncbi:MAG: ATP-binding protein [Candidatus Margulisiibacteriota bacterium]
MPDALITIDSSGLITSYNDAAEELFGRKLSGPKPQKYKTFFSGDPEVISFIEEALGPGGAREKRISISGKKEKTCRIAVAYALKDYKGRPRGVTAVFTRSDNVGRIRSEKLEALGTMAAGMAHEIKNPLSSIKILSQLLSRKFDDPEYRSHYLKIIPREIGRMDRIIDSMLGYVRASDLKIETFDLKELAGEALDFVKPQYDAKGVSLSLESKGKMKISADMQKLFQVFLNLLQNAESAVEKGGRVEIELSRICPEGRDQVEIKISDNGCGISKQDLKNIFDPFFTCRYGGTGLGLTVVHGIIKSHGGFIEVDSKEGEGTAFTIRMPACQ